MSAPKTKQLPPQITNPFSTILEGIEEIKALVAKSSTPVASNDVSKKNEKPVRVKIAAETIDCSVRHVYKLCADGKLPHLRNGKGRFLFYKSELISWIENGRKGPISNNV